MQNLTGGAEYKKAPVLYDNTTANRNAKLNTKTSVSENPVKFTCSDGERHTLTFVVSGNGIKVIEKSYCDQKLIGWSSADKYETTITHGFYPQSHFY